MGATMMPTVTGAMQTLRRESVARGTTTLNIIQQVGASIGTAVLSIVLVNAISDRLHVSGGLGAAASVPPQMRDRFPHLLTDAFGARFWWAFSLVVVAFLVALALLPKRKPQPVDGADGQAVPVLVH
jgi:hypothetical protein